MTRNYRSYVRTRQQGQTLIIALIVMGVLLVLGLVFIGLINRNILNAARSQRRSEATDLAEAGIRYAHGQLVSSPQGADWRGIPASFGAATTSRDPDIYYLRPGSGLPINSATQQIDLGGPDMLGPFVRVQFPNGRSLVRVRYGASDASPSAPVPGGPLRNPGAARSMLIIESVGRPGNVIATDPTTLTGQPLQFAGFTTLGEVQTALSAMAQANGQISTSRRLVAFAPIGIIDAARFETNVFNSSAPIELGIPDGLGIAANEILPDSTVRSEDVGQNLSMQLGTAGVNTLAGTTRGFGSMIINGDAKFFGRSTIYLNRSLGDSIRIAGLASAGTPTTALQIFDETATGAVPTATLTDGGGGGTGSFDSQDSNFDTAKGLLLDGSARTDQAGFPSGVGRLVPPSILTLDPQTKLNRYVAMTRESGATTTSGNNSGRFGYGQGIYVDNSADRQQALDAQGRKTVGSQRSLFDDWLNPNSGAADSGWKGPFYVPRGAILQLLPDGWTIQRDGSGPASERTWKLPDGTDSGRSTIRFRVGRVGNELRTLNTFSPSVTDINATTLDFSQGMPFNGVLYFEGNVRVRGTIPTDVQMTVVSSATVYIDGSIVKGTTANEVTPVKYPGVPRDQPITGLPTASLMLMARDNVAVNTSMFFGPDAAQALESVNDVTGATGISPVRLRTTGGSETGRLGILFDLLLDPTNDAGAPATVPNWKPYAVRYKQWEQTSFDVPSRLSLGITMDDGNAAASFLTMDVNFGATAPGTSVYAFNAVDPDGLITNTAATYMGVGAGPVPLYGLGTEPWQRYSRFELRAFDLVQPTGSTYAAAFNRIDQTGVTYKLFANQNDLLLRPGSIASVSTNDTLIGRVAVTPAEVKIEASLFAEQGSFFVIPGPWFNPNPNDRREVYANRVRDLRNSLGLNPLQANARAARERLEAYGAAPWVPFYGEPLDVRLSIVGSVAENLPPPIGIQSEWVRKWGWIPRRIGAANNGDANATPVSIPSKHVPAAYDIANHNFVPNLSIQYDPVLATGRASDYVPIRQDDLGRPLPPMPRLPVSPRLAYFGEL
ncbi:hypothetical protein EON82_04635 [bacterium]|nr:MAG: hypothetical protein EON82_04635 [bacterium]